jgi:hypothetical protein
MESIGTDEDGGDEDRSCDDPQGMQQGQHGDNDAGVTEARRQIECQVTLEAGDF